MPNKSIYIISTLWDMHRGLYRVGTHTGTQKTLKNSYTFALRDPVILYFKERKDAIDVDRKLRIVFRDLRLKSNSGNLSEWYKVPLPELVRSIEDE